MKFVKYNKIHKKQLWKAPIFCNECTTNKLYIQILPKESFLSKIYAEYWEEGIAEIGGDVTLYPDLMENYASNVRKSIYNIDPLHDKYRDIRG